MTTSNIKYDKHIDKFMFDVVNGHVKASKENHLLMMYLQTVLDKEDVYIESDTIQDAIDFIERYFPYKLLDWQKFLIAFIVGVFRDEKINGELIKSLVFDEFFIMIGRGAGKNGFIECIILYLISKQRTPKYNVDLVATSQKQAKSSFMVIHDIIEDTKALAKRFKTTLEIIGFKKTKSVFTYHTNNAKTKDGLRPGAVIFDEVHAYEDEENIKVFTSALGKVEYPRRFYLTTDGYVRGGFLDQLKEESKLILEGEIVNSTLFPFICKIDEIEEYKDEANWEKSNPSINYFPHLKKEMLKELQKLEHRPQSKLEFITKRMNFPVDSQHSAVTSWENIKATNQEMPDLKGAICIGAIDYADTTDFASVGLLFKKGEKFYFKQHTFINYKSLEINNYSVDYERAKLEGYVTIVRDETIRPSYLVNWFAEQAKDYKIKMIASDMYRINYLREEFEKAGYSNLEIARSGKKTHTMLEPIVEDLFAYKNIVYGDDLMMRWYTNNVYANRDPKGNITYEKIEPRRRKTDGFFCFLHALQFADQLPKEIKRRKPMKAIVV